ncbi:uncharacterized protein N7482_000364 [Penicillium canariense]|uniref:Xylanolytic transcriptional activator regulatory domain-containing protein n=1 Tax=Penicillium canariense TaxID=189055 RepID=A0A9W9IDN4_9EURO|nr:uncharacterized protein N7482_000364 [Penicillium canariense]KAJ5174487.1 hypothetical protein N7482_000364 [Penicillium canariense]
MSAVEAAMRPRTARLPQMRCKENQRPMFLPSSPDDPPESLGPYQVKSGVLEKTYHASSPGSLHGGRLYAPLEPPSALPGYLGSTSFTAVLTEHRNEIAFEQESVESFPVLVVEPDRVQSGAEVLLFLYNLKDRRRLVEKFYVQSWNVIVPKIVMDAIMNSIGEIFDGFNPNDLMPQLQNLATQIFQNSSRALVTHQSMTIKEYCASFTGRNFRWEALGNIFTLCGQQLVITPDNDPEVAEGDDPRAKDRLLEQVTVASTICLNFCDQASAANEMLAYLQYNDVMLRTQQYGDSSYQAWRRLGDLTATIYAAGLHMDTENSDDCPFFLRQWRRCCFTSAFYMDKMMATFVGRPPLLNYRYCTLTSPLDLSDEALVAGGDALKQAISELDPAGWSTQGVRHRMSSGRIRFHLSLFREKTLEIALGTYEPHDLIQKCNGIREGVRAVWEATPDHLRYDRWPEGDFHYGWLTTVYLYLNYLYTCFLLQRALIKHTNTGQEELCDISRQVLGIVNRITTKRSPMVDLDRHYSWIALTYGVPSSAVLLLELLRQSHEPGPHNMVLPRAELVRNLSVFISMLSWIARPGHGNYHTCKEAEKNLSRMLDQVLDPQPVHAEIVHDVTSGLSNFLNLPNYNSWDFSSEYFPVTNGFAP